MHASWLSTFCLWRKGTISPGIDLPGGAMILLACVWTSEAEMFFKLPLLFYLSSLRSSKAIHFRWSPRHFFFARCDLLVSNIEASGTGWKRKTSSAALHHTNSGGFLPERSLGKVESETLVRILLHLELHPHHWKPDEATHLPNR
jgi:hypothetical protein